MNFSNFYILEAFSTQSLEKALSLIKSNLESKLGVKLFKQYGINRYKNNEGVGQGLRYFLGNTTQAIRFNFNNKNEIISVDIWQANSNSKSPIIRLTIEGESIVQIIPKIVELIKNPTMKEMIEISDPTLTEAPKVTKTKLKVTPIYNEEEIEDSEYDGVEYADPDLVYDDIEKLIGVMINGKRNSVIVSGVGGVSKSFTVKESLDNLGLIENKDYVIIKGKSTAYALYQSLYTYKNKVIVFDDCDSILKNQDSLNILKSALDTGKERIVSWKSKLTFNPNELETNEIKSMVSKGRLPDHFDFRGKVIFISNIYIKDIDQALISRGYAVDVTLKLKDIIYRIETILPNLMKDIPEATMNIKKEVLNYFKYLEENNMLKKPLNVRSFMAGVEIRLSGSSDWKRLIQRYV